MFATEREYLALRADSVVDAARLYTAYILGGLARSIRPGRFHGMGRYLFGSVPVTVRRDGVRFRARPHSEDLLYLLPSHKPAVSRWFRPQAGETVVDVGAHVGLFTVLAARSGASVLSYEPNPSTARTLRGNLELNGLHRVEVVEVACGSTPVNSTLFVPKAFDGIASLHPEWVAGTDAWGIVEKVPVRVERLDDRVGRWSSAPIDWLLIDVEGSELAVFEGGRLTLDRTRRVIVEVSRRTENTCRELLEREHRFRIVERIPQTPETSYCLAVATP